ncbi:transglycosylase SLT domain-containing protein [Saccharopolyspora sp. HNM0983]|uniref:Transglycosylase SLT domain-containing protein n=1 Tax=Saccharopolyspora montiporae TaxID=2781240 RepID=A0A929BAM6_9PSEU|nr:transglycosylase SLT domain-containing protein [Saccharopolyspora sp. HNM0983]MBE9374193.1 transglycosylase SLT domain-containing protein [Saccharopolyspora sp. HNM0983]
MTPDENHSPDDMAPSTTPRRRETPLRRAATWVSSSFAGDRQRRVSPKARSIQIGAAAAAFSAVGVLALQAGPDGETEAVQPAAESAALPQAAPAPGAGDHERKAADHERAKQDHGKQHRGGEQAQPPHAAQAQAGPAKDQIDTWIDQAVTAINQHGETQLDQTDHEAIRTIIENESAGDPNAKNDWDSNASAGTPSIGLMQTIQPTFDSFALPGREDIYDPVDNIVAATLYSVDRYGGPSEVPGVQGLDSGGSYQGY